jgi:hypothetical protein
VSELTCATNAASSMLNISTGREHDAHHSVFRERLTTINRSISTVISVRVFMTFPFRLCEDSRGQQFGQTSAEHHGMAAGNTGDFTLNLPVRSCIHCIPPK